MTLPYLFLTSLLLLFNPVSTPVLVNTNNSTYVRHEIVETYPSNNRQILDTFNVRYCANTTTYPSNDFGYSIDIYSLVDESNTNDHYVYCHVLNTSNSNDDQIDTYCSLSITGLKNGFLSTIGGYSVNDYFNFQNVYLSFTYSNVYGISKNVVVNLDTNQNIIVFDDVYNFDMADYTSRSHQYTDFFEFTYFISNGAYDTFYTDGFNDGLASQSGWHLDNMLYALFDIPVLYLRSLFDFSLFGGISLFSVIVSLITISIVLFVVRKFIG